ncbi:MFS transporter [Kribbella qitaiheensis]|uniref:MFS transporter n=1 Tax=Kribbella qitaiheensis TaxID=1544730 RepID=UPI001625978C|nr:MFS transporter [Kribbella qitaiheensis]
MRILRNHDFRLLWTSNAISGIGSWLLVVAIPVQVFALTGSAAATGLTLALESLPALVIGPWAGALLDRWNLSRAMWLADLAGAMAVASILFADSADRVWIIYVAVLAENVATTVFRPAARALTPTVVGTGEDLAAANSLTAFSGSVIRLVAPPLGAVLLAGPGIRFVLAVDIISYLLSAAIIAAVSRRRAPRPTEQQEARGALHGLKYLRRSKILRGILVGNGIFLTANAGITALLVPLTVERLHAPGYGIGYLISGLGAGFLLGAAISTKAQTWLSVRNLLVATQIATAAAYVALVNAPDLSWAVVAGTLIGIPGSVLLITAETTVQRVTPTGMLARIGALFYAMDSLSVILGALIAPALIKLTDLPATLNLLAVSALLAAPVTLLAVPAHPAALTRATR